MIEKQLNLPKGKWVLANCGKYPSDKNCKMVFMAPQSQRGELLDTIEKHAVDCHAHKSSNELKKELNKILEEIEIS